MSDPTSAIESQSPIAPPVAAGRTTPAEADRRPVRAGHPSDLVAFVIGTEAVSMFAPVRPAATPWIPSDLATPVISGEASDGAEAIAAQERRRRILRRITGGCLTGIALIVGLAVGGDLQPPGALAGRANSTLASAWATKQITDEGLVLLVQGRSVLFRMGDTLPNGEVLQSTDPSTARYQTDRSLVSMHAGDRQTAPTAPH
jgi:hypothetical protein